MFEISYFLSREIVVPTKGGGIANWRETFFALMSRNAGIALPTSSSYPTTA
jgi:KUP system potassium uptake protein